MQLPRPEGEIRLKPTILACAMRAHVLFQKCYLTIQLLRRGMHAQTIMRAYTQDPFAHLLISAAKVKPLEKLEGDLQL